MQVEREIFGFISDISSITFIVLFIFIIITPITLTVVGLYDAFSNKGGGIFPRIVIFVTSFLIAPILFYTLYSIYPTIYKYIGPTITAQRVLRSPLLITILCFLGGIGAYTLRCRYRAAYAIWEILIGIVVSYQGALSRETNLLSFLGGLYIIVRGMDNLYKCINDDLSLKNKWQNVFGDDT